MSAFRSETSTLNDRLPLEEERSEREALLNPTQAEALALRPAAKPELERSPTNWTPLIAVADDSITQRQALSHLLRDRGFDIIQAGTGDEVLVQLNLLRVDAVVLDLHMPTTDGFEVLASLQNQPDAPPVLLITGMQPEDIQQNMRRLPNAELPPILTKPFDVDQLVALLHMVIRERSGKR